MDPLPIVSLLPGETRDGYLDRLASAYALTGSEIRGRLGLDVAELRLNGKWAAPAISPATQLHPGSAVMGVRHRRVVPQGK